MGIVFLELTMSLDGYVAGPNVRPDEPMGDGGEHLHDWMFEGVTPEAATAYQEALFAPVGAIVAGRRMADLGIANWGDDPTFHAPVFVVTHRPHAPIEKAGGTTYTFVTDGPDAALAQARETAGERDVAIIGGAEIGQQYLAAGAVDELRLHIAPILLGGGTPMFAPGLTPELTATEITPGEGVVHLRYRVGG